MGGGVMTARSECDDLLCVTAKDDDEDSRLLYLFVSHLEQIANKQSDTFQE
jgi:hypothetical protein